VKVEIRHYVHPERDATFDSDVVRITLPGQRCMSHHNGTRVLLNEAVTIDVTLNKDGSLEIRPTHGGLTLHPRANNACSVDVDDRVDDT